MGHALPNFKDTEAQANCVPTSSPCYQTGSELLERDLSSFELIAIGWSSPQRNKRTHTCSTVVKVTKSVHGWLATYAVLEQHNIRIV